MSVSRTDEMLEHALALHRSGAVDEAAAGYAAVLRADPANAGAPYYLAMIACQRGRFAEGAELARQSIASDPGHAPAHVLLGRALSALGRHDEALANFDRALALAPQLVPAHSSRANVLSELGRDAEAIESYDRALALAPDSAGDWFDRGVALGTVARHDEAVASFDRAVAARPDFAEAHLGRANALFELRRYAEALASLDAAVAIEPSLAEAWLGRGDVLLKLKRYDESLAAHDRALALDRALAAAQLGRGNALSELLRPDDAFTAYAEAIALKPGLAEAWLGRGNILAGRNDHDDALAAYERALALRPDLAAAWLGRGNVLLDRNRYDDALAAYGRALDLTPDLAKAWLGRGNVLSATKCFDDAWPAYGKALELEPGLAEAWLGRGTVLAERERYDDAAAAFDRSLALKPDLAPAWLGRGNVLTELKRTDEAFAAYDRAVAIKPDLKHAPGARLNAKLLLCDWTDLRAETARLLSMTRQDSLAVNPFFLLALPSSAADQLQCAKRYVRDQPAFPPMWRGETYLHDRIRVAYLSADFHEHAVAYLTAGLFEHHDKARFETTAISFGPDQNLPMRNRLKAAFERFVDVAHQSDEGIAALMRRLEIDIAVDLMGFTGHNRLGVFARRPAPIQVNYLGYSATMGASYIDYIMADRTVAPPEHAAFYSERIVWLPDSFMVEDASRRIADRRPTRRENGLPEDAFVFCCFNNSYKLAPEMFGVWMRLLAATDDSVLWLSAATPTVQSNLRRAAEQCGVSAERLIFASRTPDVADHLARQRLANLFLDTLPYNAHATASDALWAGLPVLTCLGETFAGRVAASLLKAVGLDEMITRSLEDYEALALKLARAPSTLAAIRARLARNRDSFALFDTGRSTRQIEAAYTMMWRRYQAGETAKSRSGDSEPIRVA